MRLGIDELSANRGTMAAQWNREALLMLIWGSAEGGITITNGD
jgi:hypothetical protein